jgi:hypothetical protein
MLDVSFYAHTVFVVLKYYLVFYLLLFALNFFFATYVLLFFIQNFFYLYVLFRSGIFFFVFRIHSLFLSFVFSFKLSMLITTNSNEILGWEGVGNCQSLCFFKA